MAAPAAVPTLPSLEELKQSVTKWHQQRIGTLRRKNGWLTLCGLFWLKDGVNTVGPVAADQKAADISLPAPTPASFGQIHCDSKNNTCRFIPAAGVNAVVDGQKVDAKGIDLKHDEQAGGPTVVEYESIVFNVILRAGKLAVRAKDNNSPVFTEFKGIDTFPITTQWVVPAVFEAYDKPRVLPIKNVKELDDPQTCPGTLNFTIEGVQYKLEVITEDDCPEEYFVIFRDATCGHESYGMRYLYCPRAKKSGDVVLIDFNRAYNPPCSFTNYATCPLPPKSNVLKCRVEAGEKKYGDGH